MSAQAIPRHSNGHAARPDPLRQREHGRAYGRHWREGMRRMALARAGAFCPKCGKLMTGTVDVHHKTPRAEGGKDALDNLQVMHHECHSRETRRERR